MSFIVDALIQKWAVKRERACPFICIPACFVLKVLITSIIKVDTVRSFVPIQASAFHLLAAYFFFLPLFPRGPVDARALARVPPGPRYLLWQTVGYVRRNVGSDFAPLCGEKVKEVASNASSFKTFTFNGRNASFSARLRGSLSRVWSIYTSSLGKAPRLFSLRYPVTFYVRRMLCLWKMTENRINIGEILQVSGHKLSTVDSRT